MLLEHKDSIHDDVPFLGTRPIMDGDTIRACILKVRRAARLYWRRCVIDATGDGDIFRQTGCPLLRIGR